MAEYSPARTSDDCNRSIVSSPGGYTGVNITSGYGEDGPGEYFESHDSNPQDLESGYLRAAGPATQAVPTTQQFPQYYRDEARTTPGGDTVRSGISGATEKSGLTADSGAPMLPGITKSAFEEDNPKPKRKFVLCGIRKSNFFVLVVLLLFLIVAGVAVGVGVGISRTSGSSPYSKQTKDTVASTTSAATPATT
ncbi:hypothetical protein VPNG_06211 [Cytospora leucostoma]|uniref:Uncharacterized protein n=1 Tax=Cytospora leucostoma TaxID=1230097 RepID=A0A423WYN6_9PEZI|nr:hypothetical protein VPNG_06211 [Cytospora leucostoma]